MAELAALQPCVIGPTTVRNRVTVTAHITGFAATVSSHRS